MGLVSPHDRSCRQFQGACSEESDTCIAARRQCALCVGILRCTEVKSSNDPRHVLAAALQSSYRLAHARGYLAVRRPASCDQDRGGFASRRAARNPTLHRARISAVHETQEATTSSVRCASGITRLCMCIIGGSAWPALPMQQLQVLHQK